MYIPFRTFLSTALLVALSLCFQASSSANERHRDDGLISLQFKQQNFNNGESIRVRIWGRDDNQDGVLYSMSGFLAFFLPTLEQPTPGAPLDVGNELIRIEVEFRNFLGIPIFKQVFDERSTPLDQTPNFGPTAFFGFSYNLDGDFFGDDANEGISLGPLAPSVAYTVGPVFRFLLNPGSPLLSACGLGGDTTCSAISALGFNQDGLSTLWESYSNTPIQVRKSNTALPSPNER